MDNPIVPEDAPDEISEEEFEEMVKAHMAAVSDREIEKRKDPDTNA